MNRPSGTESPPPAAEGDDLNRALALAQALLDEGRAQAALDHLSALVTLHPDSAVLYNKLGICLARLNRLEEAATTFERASALDPAYAAPWSNLGNVRLEQGRPAEAEAAYRQALAIDPDYAPAHNNLAAALRRMGRYDEAVRHLKEAVRLQRDAQVDRPLSAPGRWLFYGVLGLAAILYWAWRQRLGSVVAGAVLAGLVLAADSAVHAEAPGPGRSEGPAAEAVLPEGLVAAGSNAEGLTPSELRARLAVVAAAMLAEPIVLRAGDEHIEVVPASLGIQADIEATLRQAAEAARSPPGLSAEPIRLRLSGPDPKAVRSLAARLDRLAGQAAVEPRIFFDAAGRGTIVPGRAGRRVDARALASLVVDAAAAPRPRVVDVPFEDTRPALSEADLAPLAEARPLASYATRYDPGQAERAGNISTAARELNGLVLRPGEVFSFNEAVGPRITERGYKEAPVLLNGRLVVDVGGGVCQVSTTLYNAALLGGLSARSRAPHSRPVWYVSLARDATVAYNLIDLRLHNPAPYPVAVQAAAGGGELTVTLWAPAWAQPLPWRLRTVVEQAILAGTVAVEDPSLAPGDERLEEPAATGYVATLWRELPLYGPFAVRERVNRSYYAPRPAQMRVAPQGLPPPVPEEEMPGPE
ncbi:MAG: VanW family protein [Bacillota bacterium]